MTSQNRRPTMSANQTKYPQLRFKGFTDPWEQRKLSDGTNKIGDGLHGTPKYSEDGEVYFVNGNNLVNGQIVIMPETKTVTSNEQSKDDKALNESTILMSINGTIGNLAWYRGENLMLGKSAAYIEVSDFDKKFIYAYLQTRPVKDYYLNSLTGTTIKNLGLKAIRNTNICTPTIDEQAKIGVLFQNLDMTITLHQRKLAKLKELKKGYLQKLFPQNSEKVPEFRFKGYSDAWEKRKFVQMLNNSDGLRRGPFGSALKKAFFVKESSFVVYEQQNAIYDRFNTRYRISEKKFAELHNFEVLPGDFLLSGAGTIGRIARVPKGIEQGVFNQALIRLRINESMTDSEFFLQFIRSDFMQKNLTETNPGSAIQNLVPMSELKNWTVRTPVVNEQRKIGSLLKKIDSLIAATQCKLDLLKKLKKGYLQKMFC